MIQADAKCVVNGSKVNETINALNPLLKMGVEYIEQGGPPQVVYGADDVKILLPSPESDGRAEELFDVVELGNTAGQRYFLTSAASGGDGDTTTTTTNTSSGTGSPPPRNRENLNGGGTGNRDQLTTSNNVGTLTGGSGMPIAPGEAGFRGGQGNDRPADDRGRGGGGGGGGGGGAGMPIAPGEAGFGGGGGGAGGGDARQAKIDAKRAMKDRSGIDNGSNTVGNAPVTDQDAAIAAKIKAKRDMKRAMKDSPGGDSSSSSSAMPIAPGEAGYEESGGRDFPPPVVGGRPPNQPDDGRTNAPHVEKNDRRRNLSYGRFEKGTPEYESLQKRFGGRRKGPSDGFEKGTPEYEAAAKRFGISSGDAPNISSGGGGGSQATPSPSQSSSPGVKNNGKWADSSGDNIPVNSRGQVDLQTLGNMVKKGTATPKAEKYYREAMEKYIPVNSRGQVQLYVLGEMVKKGTASDYQTKFYKRFSGG